MFGLSVLTVDSAEAVRHSWWSINCFIFPGKCLATYIMNMKNAYNCMIIVFLLGMWRIYQIHELDCSAQCNYFDWKNVKCSIWWFSYHIRVCLYFVTINSKMVENNIKWGLLMRFRDKSYIQKVLYTLWLQYHTLFMYVWIMSRKIVEVKGLKY